jgi:hypothetical protein
VSPCLGGFEGFDLTNPRDQLGGERSHPTWSKLGHGGERFLPHHSTSDLLSFRRVLHQPQVQKREGAPLRVSSKGGAIVELEPFVLAEEKRFREFQLLGFLCRCHSTILGLFRGYFGGGLIYIESGTISPRGGRIILWREARSKSLTGLLEI